MTCSLVLYHCNVFNLDFLRDILDLCRPVANNSPNTSDRNSNAQDAVNYQFRAVASCRRQCDIDFPAESADYRYYALH